MMAALAAGSLAGPIAALIGLAVVLFGAVALIVQRTRRRSARVPVVRVAARASAGPMTCPSCLREFPHGLVFCPMDARKLVHGEEVGERRAPGVRCPRCRRAFEAGTRFCPLDAEELLPQAVWDATHAPEHDHDLHGVDGGKICPVCASKYALDASFCGKDGSELVTVN